MGFLLEAEYCLIMKVLSEALILSLEKSLMMLLKFIKNIELGNLEIKRDWGFAGDFVKAMWMMLQQTRPNDYVIATGKNSSIRDIIQIAFEEIGIYDWNRYILSYKKLLRPAETFTIKGDFSKAKSELDWEPKTSLKDVIRMMVRNDIKLQSA